MGELLSPEQVGSSSFAEYYSARRADLSAAPRFLHDMSPGEEFDCSQLDVDQRAAHPVFERVDCRTMRPMYSGSYRVVQVLAESPVVFSSLDGEDRIGICNIVTIVEQVSQPHSKFAFIG